MNRQIISPSTRTRGATRCSVVEHQSRQIYPAIVFCYEHRLNEARLKRALGEVLVDFPAFAGRFAHMGDQLEIQHNAAGIIFERHESPTPISQLLNDAKFGHPELLCPRLSPLRVLRGSEALLAVRLTYAADGCALAVIWNHALGDLHSTMVLMRAWASAYQGRAYDKPQPIADREAFLSAHVPDPPGASASFRVGSWPELVEFSYALARRGRRLNLDFSAEQLSALRGQAPVSPNDALCAHLFGAIRKLQGATAPTRLCLTVNYRKRIGVPETTLGNLVSLVSQAVGVGDDPTSTALGLRRKLHDFASEHVDYHASRRLLAAHRRPSDRLRLFSNHFNPGRGDLLVTNWSGFACYDLTFDGAAPTQYACLSELPPWFAIIYELPKSAGVCVTLSLPEELAARLDAPAGRALLYARLHTRYAPSEQSVAASA